MKKKSLVVQRIILVVLLLACIASYAFIPSVHQNVNSILLMFATGDFSAASDFMAKYGPAAAVVSFLLMVFQSVAAPLPAFLITIANANLFGWWQGALLSWTSAMAGAALCFWIARTLGQEAVEKLIGARNLQSIDRFFKRYGRHTILICRLLPFVSFDFVSYAAGLTSISFFDFIVATGIGQLPATIVYSYVGGMLTGGAKYLLVGLLILFALVVLVAIIRGVYEGRHSDDDADKAKAALPSDTV